MFAVVLFIETNEVEVIPSCWLSLDEKVAFWPPYKKTEKAKAAVVSMEEPDETWGEFLVKVFKKYGETQHTVPYTQRGKGVADMGCCKRLSMN